MNSISQALMGSMRRVHFPVRMISTNSICPLFTGRKVIECYKKDQLLIRSLYPGYWKTRFASLEWELDELIYNKERKSSSASYIPYKIPLYPLGGIGLFLNLEMCRVEGVYEFDAAVLRVDIADRYITWNQPLKTFVLRNDGSIPVLKPDIRHKALWHTYKVESIEELRSHLQERSIKNQHKPLIHNEVVVCYSRKSIVGVAAVLNNKQKTDNITNEEILTDSKHFKSIIFEKLGIDVP